MGFTQHPRSVQEYLVHLKLTPREILFVQALESYRWENNQEVFPSVGTIAKKIGVGERQTRNISKHLVELGIITKIERFAERAQLSNGYDLTPLYKRVAAWLNPEVALALAEEEAKMGEPFQPTDTLEEMAVAICEDCFETQPAKQREAAKRLAKRWTNVVASSLDKEQGWSTFLDLIKEAGEYTEERFVTPTKKGHPFLPLLAYFFSALDYLLTRLQPSTPAPAPSISSQAVQNEQPDQERSGQGPTPPAEPGANGQNRKKSGILAERAAARKAAEAKGKPKVQATPTLVTHISAASLTFNDQQPKSSIRRAANLMEDARMDEETMLRLIADARAKTSQCTQVRSRTKKGEVNRMSYFFGVLEQSIEDLIEQ